MQFYCQNTIQPKKDTKFSSHVEKWSRYPNRRYNIFFLFLHKAFLHQQTFRTCTNAFPNEFTVRSYEY